MELREHPDKFKLMAIAATYRAGMSDGERLLKKNPTYQKMLREQQKEMQRG